MRKAVVPAWSAVVTILPSCIISPQSPHKTIGKCPDHVVIVTGFNEEKLEIEIIDPNTPQFSDTYPLDRFMDAWDDSSNYMVTVN